MIMAFGAPSIDGASMITDDYPTENAGYRPWSWRQAGRNQPL